MKKKQILTAALLVLAMAAVSIVQAASFVIRDIRVEGLQRVSVGTVFNNIPYEVGQTVSDDAAREIIRSLYGTGLFKDVSLQQDGGVLVVTVVERPTIASIDITGNKDIDTDQLKQGLRDSGFAEGRVYNEFVLQIETLPDENPITRFGQFQRLPEGADLSTACWIVAQGAGEPSTWPEAFRFDGLNAPPLTETGPGHKVRCHV